MRRMRSMWVATNTALKVQWQQQLEEEELHAAEQRRLLSEADEQCLAVQQLQNAAAAEEERKKNWIHHIAIPDRPRPNRATESVLVSDFALRKLGKAQFVELYYWTNKGLADA